MHHLSGKYKSSATVIPLDQAVGKVLARDITEIRTGEFKGAAFKKGHIVLEEDIPHLKRLGKDHQEGPCGHGPRRPVPELQGVPLSCLSLREITPGRLPPTAD